MLFNCQKIGLKDKFFYDALLHRLEEEMIEKGTGVKASHELVMLGLALNMNADGFKRDNMPFLLKFYEHTYKNRFLMK